MLIFAGMVVLIAICLIIVFVIQPKFIINYLACKNPGIIFRVDTAEKILALTIDDGPHPAVTPPLLDVLAANNARATFFVLGENVKRWPGLTEEIINHGHEIGHHMMSDRPTVELKFQEFEQEFHEVDRILRGISSEVKMFRPGSGWFNKRILAMLRANGYTCCLASVYPRDTQIRWVWYTSWYILQKAKPGDIIVLHDGGDNRKRSVKVLEKFLPVLRQRGFRVTSVSEMLSKTVN